MCRGAAQFLQAEMRRPEFACLLILAIFVQCLILCKKIDAIFPHSARLQKFVIKPNGVTLRNGLSRAPAPTSCSDKFAVPQNRYALCGFYVVLWDRKSGAEFFYSDTALILLLVCFSSIAFLHRFCRLAPIEALPQTPTGLCPVPTMGFTP